MKHSNEQEEFLSIVCKSIKVKKLHKKIRKELINHIEDQKEAYILKGMNEQAALSKSIKDMGDPIIVGKEFNEAHKPLVEWSILITIAFLILTSGILQYIFDNYKLMYANTQSSMFRHFLFYAPLGFAIFLVAYLFNYSLIKKYAWHFYVLYLVMMLILLKISPVIRGRSYYTYYPSLLFIPIFSALIYRFRGKGYLGIILSGIVCFPPLLITLNIPSLQCTLIIIISCLITLTFAIKKNVFNCNKKLGLALVYVPTITTFILTFVFLIANCSYRYDRFYCRISQNLDPKAEGYMLYIIRQIITSAKPFGSVLINNHPIQAVLPNYTSENTFAFIIGSFGYVPAIIISIAILFLLYRLYKVTSAQSNTLGKLISLGCLSLLSLQFISSLLNNIGINFILQFAPPLLSYGSLSFVFSMGLLGLMLSVYRLSNIVDDRPYYLENKNNIISYKNGKLTVDFNKINLKISGKNS
ncbi:FtsW/RodA/SpoVE family cell cycle protein [Clostridiaceae bacterium M8S5]|nr:FtsW/RodA/SpoVE family cell cycle protein [Clostridiaceae bacterium M8S5]